MSKHGFQPTPLTPPDFKEFLQFQNNLNSMLKQTLHQPSKVKLGEPNKKSKDKHNDRQQRGNRDRRVKSDVHKLTGRHAK